MEKGSVGQILALVGFVVLLLAGLGRQQAYRRRRLLFGGIHRLQQLGSLAAIALIIIGLILMATAK